MRIGDDGLTPNGSAAISGRSMSRIVCERALECHRPAEPAEQLRTVDVAQDVARLVVLGGGEALGGRRTQREDREPVTVELDGASMQLELDGSR